METTKQKQIKESAI